MASCKVPIHLASRVRASSQMGRVQPHSTAKALIKSQHAFKFPLWSISSHKNRLMYRAPPRKSLLRVQVSADDNLSRATPLSSSKSRIWMRNRTISDISSNNTCLSMVTIRTLICLIWAAATQVLPMTILWLVRQHSSTQNSIMPPTMDSPQIKLQQRKNSNIIWSMFQTI